MRWFRRKKQQIRILRCWSRWCLFKCIYVCLVYGPIAAYLIEAFPAKVRYTSLSLPYHIGNGIFGGLLPLIGLIYVRGNRKYLCRTLLSDDRCCVTFVVGSMLLRETHGHRIWDEVSSGKLAANKEH